MCLELKSLEAPSKPILCYKVYRWNHYYPPGDKTKEQLEQDFQSTGIPVCPIYYGNNFDLGYVKPIVSDRPSRKLHEGEERSYKVYLGIHVFTDLDCAILFVNERPMECLIVEVECRPDDFVAAGIFDRFYRSAVYMKVFPVRLVGKKSLNGLAEKL